MVNDKRITADIDWFRSIDVGIEKAGNGKLYLTRVDRSRINRTGYVEVKPIHQTNQHLETLGFIAKTDDGCAHLYDAKGKRVKVGGKVSRFRDVAQLFDYDIFSSGWAMVMAIPEGESSFRFVAMHEKGHKVSKATLVTSAPSSISAISFVDWEDEGGMVVEIYASHSVGDTQVGISSITVNIDNMDMVSGDYYPGHDVYYRNGVHFLVEPVGDNVMLIKSKMYTDDYIEDDEYLEHAAGRLVDGVVFIDEMDMHRDGSHLVYSITLFDEIGS